MSNFDHYDWMFTSPPINTDRVEERKDTTNKTNRSCRHVAKANALKKNTKKSVVTSPKKKETKRSVLIKKRTVHESDEQHSHETSLTKKPRIISEIPPTEKVQFFSSRDFVVDAAKIIESADVINEFNNKYKDRKSSRCYKDYCRHKAQTRNDIDHKTFFKYNGILEVSLEYPGSDFRERYLLAYLYNGDGYFPVDDLMDTVNAIIEIMFKDEIAEKFQDSRIQLDEETSLKKGNIDRRLTRAKNRGNWVDFVNAIKIFNQYLQEAKKAGNFLAVHITTSDPNNEKFRKLIHHIIQQVYDRVASPEMSRIIKRGQDKSQDYGELLPPFIDDIIQKTQLNRNSIFMDFGSGVGNVCLQIAAQVGCSVYGIEVLPERYNSSVNFTKEFLRRTSVTSGPIEIYNMDLRRIGELRNMLDILGKADIVLCNNLAFDASLNNFIKDLFLSTKSNAQVITLVPLHDIVRHDDNIWKKVVEHKYNNNWVSWTSTGGSYYQHIRKDDRES
ncbi:527_t:CDS:2 [Diversispora eburnea]|uniref:Histone-lysine N-methyltransferase, H3 lysine-79 specific n=1 Tax=Diversispora eburnea TaxID=1213867 RepID=A0A9N8YLZ6_9GLOM|nr:527_t:CDS:2 [Diversispora eburnea]